MYVYRYINIYIERQIQREIYIQIDRYREIYRQIDRYINGYAYGDTLTWRRQRKKMRGKCNNNKKKIKVQTAFILRK